MNIKNILLPFDGSSHSLNATECAMDLAKRYQASVTIVYCYEEWDANVAEIPESLIADIKSARKDEARNLIRKAESILEDSGVNFTLETIDGEPGYVLSNMSKSGKYDLIIMGSHGHSDIAGLFLGSVTHKVLNTIYCPVMVVP